MLVRFLVLAVIVGAAHLALATAQRHRGIRISPRASVPVGLTLVVAEGCATCGRAIAALDAIGVPYRVVDMHAAGAFDVASFTAPYAFVGRADGSIAIVRRGEAVIRDADRLAHAVHNYP